MKRIAALLTVFLLLPMLFACARTETDTNISLPEDVFENGINLRAALSNFDTLDGWDAASVVTVQLNGDSVSADSEQVQIDGTSVTLNGSGTYLLQGTLRDGNIVVRAEQTEKVHLILNGVSVSSSETAPLVLKSADKMTVTLVEGTENVFDDTTRVINKNEEDLRHNINACIYAEDDLSFNGTGTLTVHAANNAIGCRNDVRFADGTYHLTAKKNGIKGKNSVFIAGGTFTIEAGNDGIKSSNLKNADKGFVLITGGTVSVTAKDDGIQAITDVTVLDGRVVLHAVSSKINCAGTRYLTEGCVS